MKKLNILLPLGLAATLCLGATDMGDLKIYVNPGHGGYDSDDRNVAVPPYSSGDSLGFWESKSNLVKGLALRDLLQGFGADVMMSRTTNTTDDDRGLEEIGLEANSYGADFFFSIHSNATGTSSRKNQPLMLYRGYTDDPISPEAKVMSGILNDHLLENRVTSWSSESQWLAGDWTFYPAWNNQGLGVLRRLTVPGLLSEGSYHDYIPETYRLLNNEYCWLEAYHFTKAVMEYFSTTEAYTTGVVAGSIYDSRLVRTESVYNDIFYGHDESKPICGATVELVDGTGATVQTYTTDELFNGVYLFKDVTPGDYTVKISCENYNSYEGAVTVQANTVTYNNVSMDRIRNTAPEVVSYSPVWAEGDDPVLCNVPVVLEFNWDMDTQTVEDNFSITPAVDGTLTWEDSQYRLVFEPARAYETNTVYTVRLGKEAQHPGGMQMADDFEFSFMTDDYNTLLILANSPSEGEEVHYSGAAVKFIFDKHPQTTSLSDELTITDSSGNELSYSVRTRKFSSSGDDYGYYYIKLSSNLDVGSTYTMNVASTVCDENGIKIAEPFSYTFTAVDASADASDLTAVETFDGTGVLAADTDGSSGCSSWSVARQTSTKLEGTAAYKLTYAFSAQEGGVAYSAFASAPATAFTNQNRISLKVYGDLTGNSLSAVFTDGTQTVSVPVCTLDFFGWHSVDASLSTLPDGNFSIAGFAIGQAGTVYGASGEVYLDELSVGADEDGGGITDVEIAGLRVYPNPASELLIANASCPIYGVELYSAEGRLAASSAGNVVNVSELATGVYVAKIYTSNGTATQRVAVRH